MAFIEIPLSNQDPSFLFSIELDGSTYNFTFRWDGRQENWIFDLFDSDKNPIQTGVPFVVDLELISQNVSSNRPPGNLIARNTAISGENATRFNIGSDVKLYYREAES
jgi:hypothetical protein